MHSSCVSLSTYQVGSLKAAASPVQCMRFLGPCIFGGFGHCSKGCTARLVTSMVASEKKHANRKAKKNLEVAAIVVIAAREKEVGEQSFLCDLRRKRRRATRGRSE
jgi:hypothetical protein